MYKQSTTPCATLWNTVDQILNASRDLGFDVVHHEEINGKNLDVWEIGGCAALCENAVANTESFAISLQRAPCESGPQSSC